MAEVTTTYYQPSQQMADALGLQYALSRAPKPFCNQKLIWIPSPRSKPEARVKALKDLCVLRASVISNPILSNFYPMYTCDFVSHLHPHNSSASASV